MHTLVRAFLVVVLAAGAPFGAAQAQYPEKPVRLLIPFPPGGPTDSAVRVFLPALSHPCRSSTKTDRDAAGH